MKVTWPISTSAPGRLPAIADKALSRLEIDALGLDAMDRRYLTMIADLYGGGPVGVETLAAALAFERVGIAKCKRKYRRKSSEIGAH